MATIPSVVHHRFKENIKKFQTIIAQAKDKDINEADTVTIVFDVLTSVFGYDKYNEITKEYVIKGTYCDLAVKVNGCVKFLIEVKAIGINLQKKHYQQALDYGANCGIEWIILTNGINWQIYKVKFEKPISTELICEMNFLDIKIKKNDLDKLFILCKEGIKKNAIDDFAQHKMVVNKFFVTSIIQGEVVKDTIKRELKKIDSAIKPKDDEIYSIINNDIIKRELIDSSDTSDASKKYHKILKKGNRAKENRAKESIQIINVSSEMNIHR